MKNAPIKRVAIIIKKNQQKTLAEAKTLAKWLKARKVTSFFEEDVAAKLKGDVLTYNKKKFANIDLLICLGGDGTLLSTVKYVIGTKIPILGVNMGSLGFLTEISLKNMYTSLERVLKGDYTISKRATFSAAITHGGKTKRYNVLNDVVINKRSLAKIIDLELTINDTLVTTYNSDGLIISTPTGSTGYSLSAGGPIIHPKEDCMMITPICPHTLTQRPIIVPGNSTIKVRVMSKSDDVQLTLDGQISNELEHQNEVIIKKSDKKIMLIESFEKNYFEVLRTKLHWGKRGTK